MIILTMYCTTRWLDGKQNFILEIVRIALFTLISVFTYLTDLEYFLTYGLTVYLIVNVILIPFLSKAASN